MSSRVTRVFVPDYKKLAASLDYEEAVRDVVRAVEALIPQIERIDNLELLKAINEHLQALHDYVEVMGRLNVRN